MGTLHWRQQLSQNLLFWPGLVPRAVHEPDLHGHATELPLEFAHPTFETLQHREIEEHLIIPKICRILGVTPICGGSILGRQLRGDDYTLDPELSERGRTDFVQSCKQ